MSKFELKKGEEGYVHLTIQREEFSKKTGKALFKPSLFTCTPREFVNFLNHPNGMVIKEINHLPEGMKIPKMKVKEGKKTIEKTYPVLEGVEMPQQKVGDDPVSLRTKALKKLTVEKIDEVLEGLELPIEGNKGEKIEAILESEFSEEGE